LMKEKIGLYDDNKNDKRLINQLLTIMSILKLDFTNVFAHLSKEDYRHQEPSMQEWIILWRQRVEEQSLEWSEIYARMRQVNPYIIPRNHQIEKVLNEVRDHKDYTSLHQLIKVLEEPFSYNIENVKYTLPPEPEERVTQTFCGT